MTYNFFSFICAINLNDNLRITCRKTKICLFNFRFLHTFLYRITTRSTKSLFLQNYLTKKISKCLRVVRFKPNVRKTAHPVKKHLDLLGKKILLEHPNFKIGNLPKLVCLRRNHRLYDIITKS